MRHDDGSLKQAEERTLAQRAANERARPRSMPVAAVTRNLESACSALELADRLLERAAEPIAVPG